MNKPTPEQIADVLRLHKLWLEGKQDGRRANLSGANLSRAYLSGAYLSEANLSRAYLSEADLSEANLSRADLSEAYLSEANLSRADLSEADLSEANLSRADLSEAYLSRANLSRAYLSRADLSEANLSEANLSEANLSEADLSGASGLAAVDPVPEIRSRLLEAVSRDGCKLYMKDWHTCETTHCLAGWTTHIHPQGKLLESILGCSTAAALILNASGEKIPNFFDTSEGADERAMNWLRTGQQVNSPEPAGAAS